MAWKEFVVLMFLGFQFVKAGIRCELKKEDSYGHVLYYYNKYCNHGCCNVQCCSDDDAGPDMLLIVLCSVLGGVLFIVLMVSVIVCCIKSKVCLCYKMGYAGRTIAPAPVHIPLENVQPNNRLPPLERPVEPLHRGNTFNNYYQRGCTFVRPGLPPIRDAVGYHSPTHPPGYLEESQQPPSYDHGQERPPLTLEHNAVSDMSRNLPPTSRQRLQQSSSTTQTQQDISPWSTEQSNQNILSRSTEQTNQSIPARSTEQANQNIPPMSIEQSNQNILSRSTEQTNHNIPPWSTEQSNQNILPRSTEQTSNDNSPPQVPGQISSIGGILQDQNRLPARLPPLTVQHQP